MDDDEDDEIIREIREFRAAHAAKFNFDLDAIFEDMRLRTLASGRALIHPPSDPIVAGEHARPAKAG